ncbi:MAG: diguanylate cyclase [Solobacterium sp.]|nr:diguanylate cyclase [Solobacterium sp.]
MKTVLYICEAETHENEQIITCLKEDGYDVIVKHSVKEVLSQLREEKYDPSVILVDSPSALNGAEKILAFVEETNDLISRTPILIVSDEAHLDSDLFFLKGEVVDVILKPVRKEVLLDRVANIIDAYQSVNFNDFANMLRALPANIYLKDAQGRYVFSSHIWNHFENREDPEWTIRGKTDPEIRKDRQNAKLAMESDRRILESGKGISYIIQERGEGITEYLQLIKEPLFSGSDKIMGIVALVNNVTEQEVLRQKLKEQSVTDSLTGIFNRACFEERIREGFQNFEYPVSFISGDCDHLKKINDTFGHQAGDVWIRKAAELLQKGIGEKGTLYRTGGDEFVAVLTNTDAKACEAVIHFIRTQAEHTVLYDRTYRISLGYSVLNGKEDDLLDCLRHSDENMYQNKQNNRTGE